MTPLITQAHREEASKATRWLINPMEVDYSNPVGEYEASVKRADAMAEVFALAIAKAEQRGREWSYTKPNAIHLILSEEDMSFTIKGFGHSGGSKPMILVSEKTTLGEWAYARFVFVQPEGIDLKVKCHYPHVALEPVGDFEPIIDGVLSKSIRTKLNKSKGEGGK